MKLTQSHRHGKKGGIWFSHQSRQRASDGGLSLLQALASSLMPTVYVVVALYQVLSYSVSPS